jgi:Ca2+-binding EF-hand superfamily protein
MAGVGIARAQAPEQPQVTPNLPGPIDSIQDLQDTAKMVFKLADTNNDGQISQKEAVDAGNLLVGGFFFRADSNGDGTLTAEEARQARESLMAQKPFLRLLSAQLEGRQPAAAAPGSAEAGKPTVANAVRTVGSLLDTNQDKKIEATEVREAVQTSVQGLFNLADTNRDNQISPAELNGMADQVVATAMQTAFQTADADNNGAISQAEFDKAIIQPAHVVFQLLDANHDSQLTQQELQRAQQLVVDQIRRMQIPEPANSLTNRLQSRQPLNPALANPRTVQPGTQPTQPAPAPVNAPAPR